MTNEPEITFRYTSHQVARGSRPDAELNGKMYLIKNVSQLGLTYQIRLLTYRAHRERKRLVIRLPQHGEVTSALKTFINDNRRLVAIERF